MRKIRDVLRLSAEGLSERRIRASLGIGHSGVGDTIRRARAAGLAWPLPADLSDDDLERQLYRKPAANAALTTGVPGVDNQIMKAAQDADILWSLATREQTYANKFQEACTLAERWPELKSVLPPKRQWWQTEDPRMIVFEALSLALSVLEKPEPPVELHW